MLFRNKNNRVRKNAKKLNVKKLAEKVALALGLLVFFSQSVHARPNRPFYQAGRALAMGDAYTAVGTGWEAVYYNPAGLAKRNSPSFKFFDIETQVSKSFLSLFSGSYTKFLNMQQLLADVQSNPNTPYTIGMSLLPQFMVRNFSFGLLFRGQTEATYNSTTTDTNMYSFADLGMYTHYAVALAGGVIKLGVGGKVINRAELDRTYTAAEVSSGGLSFSNQWQEGWGYGVDAGALIVFPVTGLPTLGLSIQDIGHTDFYDKRLIFTGDSSPQGAPQKINQKVNAGFSTIVKHGRGIRSVLAVDVKGILGLNGTNYLDKLHAGWEMSVNKKLFLRAGVNQGRYWTAGFGISLGGLGLEFATYGENIADEGATRQADRKYIGRYVLSF